MQAYLNYDWDWWARPDQLAPLGSWDVWLILAGRGWGKTRTGAEWVKQKVAEGCKHIACVAETAADARDVMVEGPAGILSIYPADQMPQYEPSKRRVTWPNGAMATFYNAREPDQLRGPQHDAAWSDELAKWRYVRDTWDNLQFGMRLGVPQQVITTTPRPIPIIRELIKDEGVVVTRGRTLDNAPNLAATFLKRIRAKYEGTRRGRQELDAEVLDDLPDALWKRGNFDNNRLRYAPKIERKVVAIDPAISSEESSEDPGTHGIVAVGKGIDGRGYVLEDCSLQGTPHEWASRAVQAYKDHDADTIVVEINQGGDMAVSTLRTIDADVPIKRVRATRGKHVRAEPVSGLYEQNRVSHIGSMPELEDQLCDFTSNGYEGEGSPDRADALVWGMTSLFSDIILHTDQPDDVPEPPARRYFKKKGGTDWRTI